MPLKNQYPASWPWMAAAAWIGFDLLDELDFHLTHPQFPNRIGLSRQEVATRCAATAEELAAAVVSGRLRPRWTTPERSTSTRGGGRDDLMQDNIPLASLMKDRLAGVLNMAGCPLDGLEFDRSEVLELWPADPPMTQAQPEHNPPGPKIESERDGSVPESEPAAASTPGTNEKGFILWATAEKKKHGQWPPTDTEKTGARMGWRQWATTNGICRETVGEWVKVHGLSNPVGAPKKSVK